MSNSSDRFQSLTRELDALAESLHNSNSLDERRLLLRRMKVLIVEIDMLISSNLKRDSHDISSSPPDQPTAESWRKSSPEPFTPAHDRGTNDPVPLLKCELCFVVINSVRACFWIVHIAGDKTMIIGDRLRALREEKKLSQGDIEERTFGFSCAAIYLVWKTGTLCRPWETLEKFAPVLSMSLCINSFMMVKSRPSRRIYRRGKPIPNYSGPRVGTRGSWRSSEGSSANLMRKTIASCCLWRRRWRDEKPPKLNCLEVGRSDMSGASVLPDGVVLPYLSLDKLRSSRPSFERFPRLSR